MAKNNSYEKKAQKRHFLEGFTSEQTKGDLKKTALETGRDLLIGAIGGGLAGAAVGRASLLVGLAVTGVGHYMGSDGATSFGVGMMASGSYQAVTAVNGIEKEGMDGVKERLIAFKDQLKEKLFLDKIITSTKSSASRLMADETTDGVGDVQYFTYPDTGSMQGIGELDLSALDRIERQVDAAASKYQARTQGVSGTEEAMEIRDVNDRIL
jgi:hypothetical protein